MAGIAIWQVLRHGWHFDTVGISTRKRGSWVLHVFRYGTLLDAACISIRAVARYCRYLAVVGISIWKVFQYGWYFDAAGIPIWKAAGYCRYFDTIGIWIGEFA